MHISFYIKSQDLDLKKRDKGVTTYSFSVDASSGFIPTLTPSKLLLLLFNYHVAKKEIMMMLSNMLRN